MQPILTIDLDTREIGTYTIPKEWEHDYLGGASLAARILFDVITPDLDPLSPRAPLLLLNGPLSGTSGPAVGRFVITGRSPATRLWGESNCGGFWGPELRMAGFDGLWITGRAENPVYLWITNGQVQIRPANHLWGLETYATQAAVQKELDGEKARIAVIGPAGEAQIGMASILTDHGRVAARTGMGAVMGSKNLKAIAVAGKNKVPVSDSIVYAKLRSEANRALRTDPESLVAHELGTASVAEYMDYLGLMPKRYYQTDVFEGAGNISGSRISETILVGTHACHACVIACGRVVRLEDGERRKGPEYETLVGFGPNLWLADPAFATRMGELCDRFGIDTISLSNTIGLAIKLYDQGLITEGDTGGLKLDWGDPTTVEWLVTLACYRQGFGLYLTEGARALGRRFGVEDEAVQINGLEVPYHDPRGGSGMALSYATSPRGACHNQSDYFMVEIGQAESSLGIKYLSRHAGAEKAGSVAIHQNWRTLFNSLVLCYFANVPPESMVPLINAACGENYSLEDILRVGERGWNLKRAINVRLGLRPENDRLPKDLLLPHPPGGGTEGYIPPFTEMLLAYYEAREWDPQTGMPTVDKVSALGLEFVLDGTNRGETIRNGHN